MVGVGDEELALVQLTPQAAKEKCLSREQKLERLKKLLESVRNLPSATAVPACRNLAAEPQGPKKE